MQRVRKEHMSYGHKCSLPYGYTSSIFQGAAKLTDTVPFLMRLGPFGSGCSRLSHGATRIKNGTISAE